jgi:tRNA threonylcarbamoyladenosine dehydratase
MSTSQWVGVADIRSKNTTSKATAPDQRYRLHRRFDRLGRLYGDGSVEHLMSVKVVVFGLGGVGSFAAESLARSAIGYLGLVDFDDVCVTNVNRQLQALKGSVGQPKADVLRERLQLINPQAKFVAERTFYNAERSESLLRTNQGHDWDLVVDCIDNMTAKAHLLASCRDRGIKVVSSMGAAGRVDPTQIRIADLSATQGCPMAKDLRKILRRKHGFPKDAPFSIPAVFSSEKRTWPRELSYDGGKGFVCVCPHKSDEHGCDSRSLIDGTVSFVTGTFGLMLASVVVNHLVGDLPENSPPGQDRYGFRKQATEESSK